PDSAASAAAAAAERVAAAPAVSADRAASAVLIPAAPAEKAGPAPSGVLQFRTSEVAWIEVQDANGSLLLSRDLRAGEAVGINAATPLKVILGNVKATQVVFRGKAVELRSFTRDNVARFELN
ncbi:MAG: DUF4115 domain-containing protein, partial [Burkholderiaceae bacterium]